jgi:sucrose synthase
VHILTLLLHRPVRRYAKSERLRKLVNLVVVGGVIDPENTGDREERAECEKMHGLVEKYNLKVRQSLDH